MGRTIKISELKKFDVFHYPKLHADYNFLYIGGEDYSFVTTNYREHNPHTFRFTDKEEEVELLGRMEFIDNKPINNMGPSGDIEKDFHFC